MTLNLSGSSTTLFHEASQQNVSQTKLVEKETMTQKLLTQKAQNSQTNNKYEWKIVWKNVISIAYLHIGALYGVYLLFTVAKLYTFLWSVAWSIISVLGVTGGAHRLWAHRTYKAKVPLRVILMILQTAAFQNHIYEWVRDHRVHHKFMDTDADPHNSKRGFFFSHVGWLLIRKHPDVISKGATVDLSDLEKDPVVVWQRKYYAIIMPLFCFVMPMCIPVYFWNEKPVYAWYVALLSYIIQVNGTWCVNSAAHLWGMKPYEKTISATDSSHGGFVGEFWHNYHHVFPWDYKAAELGRYRVNFTCAVIDFFAWLGWAYDLKTVRHDLIKKRAARTGDNSIYELQSDLNDECHHTQEKIVWGWDDADMSLEDKQGAEILNEESRD
ncbi:PREDICTED: acyl-CoA Delta(11) desaturase-like [Vollenhovia emeryi]|uniref:acyl-CoA Delta(11) desaturase-like n=1 Tax=Vollenhovia emeryi TaxID=411798 RepID=UPI0005F4ED19|nr:PREDICTED: acyl-CoA Delta(11) desaturase-like [Vollenhovia emeryi]